MEENQTQKNKNSFVREKIKDKPFNKKRAILRLLVSALSGIVFAGMASLVFALVLPRIRPLTEVTPTEEKETITTEVQGGEENKEPEDQVSTEPEKDSAADNDGDNEKENETDIEADVDTKQEESETTGETDNVLDDVTGDASDIVVPDVILPEYSLTLSDYQKLQDELYGIGASVNASVVTITSVVSDTDLFNNAYEAEDQGSGVIISENDNEYLILTERKVIKDASRISVTFLDDTICEAQIKKEDKNTGLAVLAVDKMSAGTAKTVATIGNTLTVHGGMIAIALGSPLGTNYSILTGNITSTNNEISVEDHNYSVYTTDIVANKDGSGILINVDGEIVGIVMQDYSASRTENTLTAISAVELQGVINKLCAGEDVPYIGIKVSTVTNKIENAYGIPKGVYIKEVTMDSPAMKAGLQSGDVITKINGAEVRTDVAYANILLAMSAGDVTSVEIKRKGASEYSTITYDVTIGAMK